jgi:hypothetical protein
MNSVLDQLARTGVLPTELAGEILTGKLPPISETTLHLLIAAMDVHAMTDADQKVLGRNGASRGKILVSRF